MLGPDEPRYAAIGQAMAQTGDWITPRLWGQPWFEKPPLLYWMTAAGFKLGWGPDLAPRLPVALLSAAFLLFFWWILRRQYAPRVAWYATAILATSAGWLAYSHIAVTDLPLSVCFAAAMLLLLPPERTSSTAGVRAIGASDWIAGGLLGLAVLAKGLVPLVLFLPAIWFWRGQWKRLALVLTVAIAVAAPWYVLVTYRNGMPFLDEFFLKHHFARFTSGSLQHVRPFWFYAPVLLGAIFPWTPTLLTLFRKSLYAEPGEQFLLAWLLFGLFFFSASRNKLPGYLLPLMPALAALLGIALARTPLRWTVAASAVLFWLIPPVADLLPQALLNGLSRTTFRPDYVLLAPLLLLGLVLWRLETKSGRDVPIAVVALGMVIATLHILVYSYPLLDRSVSARAFWRSEKLFVCNDMRDRAWRYGLNYYAQRTVPDCKPAP